MHQFHSNHASYIVVTVDASHRPVDFFHLHAGIADYFHHGGQCLFFWNFEPLDIYDSALTNELRTIVIHSRSVYSQTRLADFGYITECKSKNPRGLNEVSLPLARNGYFSVK